jgi:hypothetical protein
MHLVHNRLKMMEHGVDALTWQLCEVFILTPVGLKESCLDLVGAFMEALQPRSNLVSNLKIIDTIELTTGKKTKDRILGSVVSLMPIYGHLC